MGKITNHLIRKATISALDWMAVPFSVKSSCSERVKPSALTLPRSDESGILQKGRMN